MKPAALRKTKVLYLLFPQSQIEMSLGITIRRFISYEMKLNALFAD